MLTDKQRRLRAGKLTGSRIACLMTGDAEKIMRLYREMIGEEQEEDLSHVWAVRLGEATETLNLDWFEEKNKVPVTRRGEVVVDEIYDWAACTLDGWIQGYQPLTGWVPAGTLGYPIECKHVGGREPIEVVVDRYQPQCQWIMAITGAKQIALSIIAGANEPVVEYIERDDAYIKEMFRRGKQFMQCVATRTLPVALPAVAPLLKAEKIYDMKDNQDWRRQASVWLQTYQAAQSAKDAEKVLKSLVPEDAAKAHGAGVRITRDRAGRLSLRKED